MRRLSQSHHLWFTVFLITLLLLLVSRDPREQTATHAQSNAQDRPALLLPTTGHTKTITSLAYSPNGRVLASGNADNTIRLWLVDEGIPIRTLSVDSPVESIDFSPDGKLLVSGGQDKILKLWDVESGKMIRSFLGHGNPITTVRFSPDGRVLSSSSWDTSIKLWNVASGRQIKTFDSSDPVFAIEFSPDGRTLVSGGGDNTITLWETQTGRKLETLYGHTDLVSTIAFTPNGSILASGSADNTIRLWDLKSQKLIGTFKGNAAAVALAFSPDGKILSTGSDDRTVKLWDVPTGRELRTLKDQSKGVTAIAFNPDGKSLASSSGRTIDIWSVSDGSLQKTLESHSHAVNSVAFNDDGTLLACGNDENTIKIWDLKQGKLIRSLRGHTNSVTSVAFSPDGRTLASGSSDNTVRVWDTATGLLVHTLAGHASFVSSVSFSPDGKSIASGSYDRSIKVWETVSGRELRVIKYFFPLTAVAFSPNGKTIAGSSLLQISLNDLETGTQRTFTTQFVVNEMAFSPDGNTLAAATWGRGVELWNVASGQRVRTIMEESSIITIAFSQDGKILAIGTLSGSISLWDVQSTRRLSLSGHSKTVWSVAFTPNGQQLASGSDDGTIKLWSVNKVRELASLLAVDENDWIVSDDQGRVDASPNSQRLMYWSIRNNLISFEQLKARYYEPGLLSKVSSFSNEPLRDVSAFRTRLYPAVELKKIAKGSKELTVSLTNQGGGIGRIQVFVNGKEYLDDARPEGLKRNPNVPQATLKIDLSRAPVLADNVVRVVTWNLDDFLANQGTEIDWHLDTESIQEPPEFYAIVGGISEYAGDSLRLRYAAKDAEAMAKALELGAKRLFGADRVHITLLATSDNPQAIAPTKANFKKAFDSVAKTAKPADELVVYLAGQGWAASHGVAPTYLYLTQEANIKDVASLADQQLQNRIAISSNELAQWIKVIPALKQVFILDTCGSGAAARLFQNRDVPANQARALARLQDRTGAWMLMGSAADAVSYEASQYGSGLLTHALLEGMRGPGLREQTFVDVATLFRYVQERVPNLAKAIGGTQTPVVFSPSQNNSFDIGMLTVEDRAAIPLSVAKPLILRPTFINDAVAYDDLRITSSVTSELVKESSSSQSGQSSGRIVFVDVDEMPQAIRAMGIYSVTDSKVRLRLRLIRDNRVISSVNVEGETSNLQRFAGLITETIIQEITNKTPLQIDNREARTKRREARMMRLQGVSLTRQSNHHYVKQSLVSNYDSDWKTRITEIQADSPSFLIVRPSIYNRKPGAGDDLNLRDEVIKGLKSWAADKSDPVPIEFKDVDTHPGAYQFEGTYERHVKGFLRLSLSVKLNGVVLAQPTPSVCDSNDLTRIAELFIEMARLAISSLPLKRGTEVVSEADLEVLNYKLRSYALLIATNDYDKETGWKPLANPICDAEAIKKELVEHYGFDEKADVFTAYNQDYDGVWNSIDALHNKVYPADEDTALFVFIAGHGAYDERRKKGMLALRNSRMNDPKGINYYRFSNLLEDIGALPFNHIFVVVDACQSGDAINDTTARSPDPNVRSDAEFIVDKLKNKKTRKAFTSASYNNVDDGPKGGHSPFAERLLDAFKKYGSNDRFLTIDEIWTLGGMDRLTTDPRHGWFKGNTPGSDFLFIAQPKVKEYQCLAACNCN